MKLTSKNVDDLIMAVLFTDEETQNGKEMPKNAIQVEGLIHTWGFHPERLESHRQDVKSLLEQLPDTFRAVEEKGGGGMSFLNLPFDRDGHQWGEQRNAEALYALGAGLGYCRMPFPNFMWPALPGGVPYIMVDLREKADVVAGT